MALSRLGALIGGMLVSKAGRRFAGRHAGKLALATIAWELYQQHRDRGRPVTPGARPWQQQAQASHPRRRWSGRRA